MFQLENELPKLFTGGEIHFTFPVFFYYKNFILYASGIATIS